MSTIKEPIPWSGRRFIWCVFLLIALQITLIMRFSAPAPSGPLIPASPTVVRFPPLSTADSNSEWFNMDDPALFALVSPKGFSGSAWLRLNRFPYQLTNTVEPPRWLEASASQFGRDLHRFASKDEFSWIAAAPKSRLQFPNIPQAVAPRVLRPHLRVEGELAGRGIISTMPLPAGDPEKASKCAVQVAVNPEGDVISHSLATSSGSAIADQQALNFARSARFAPVEADHATVTFGFLVFHWFAAKLDAPVSEGP